MVTIGIDPGKYGCICILDSDSHFYYDLDLSEDVYNDLRTIKKHWNEAHIFLETTYIQGRATRGLMSFLHGRGTLYGACSILWPGCVHDVRPQEWQKPYDAPSEYKARKEYFVEIAMEKFPEADIKTKNKDRTSGRADATFIAYYGKQQ